MKYLVEYLEGLSDGPRLNDPDFQHLLLEVEAGKSQARSVDAFYENLEKVVNELRTSPESIAFQKPVSKREAPDYYDIIKQPMDLSTVLRHVKAHKYKNKAEFEKDVNLIWENCFTYNVNEAHPIRNSARTMKQKADYFLSFVVDKNERAASSIAALLPPVSAPSGSTASATAGGSSLARAQSSAPGTPIAVNVEDADGPQQDTEDRKQFFRAGAGAGDGEASGSRGTSRAGSAIREPQGEEAGAGRAGSRRGTPAGRRSVSRARSRQATSAAPEDLEGSADGTSERGRDGGGTSQGQGSGEAGVGYSFRPSSLAATGAHSVEPSSAAQAAPESTQGHSAAPASAAAGSRTTDDPSGRDRLDAHGLAAPTAGSSRPPLAVNLDQTPALVRTPWTLTSLQPVSLVYPTPTWADKGKAKEVLHGAAVPDWYAFASAPVGGFGLEGQDAAAHEEAKAWALMSRDEAYVAGLPAVPTMCAERAPPRRKIPGHKRRRVSLPSGTGESTSHRTPSRRDRAVLPPTTREPTPALSPDRKTIDLGSIIDQTAENLDMARTYANKIADWQRAEADGGVLPGPALIEREEKAARAAAKAVRAEKKRAKREREALDRQRRREGVEMGEARAAEEMRRAAGAMLAHAGFEGASDSALDLFTRIAIDQISSLGRTLRLLSDGFCQKMSSEDILLHALYERGDLELHQIETHVKDEVERENGRIKEALRKMRQAHREVTTAPVIQDDMLLDGEMLLDGNFADELGEDFLGLRQLGIDKEEGLASLTIPSAIFYGRRKRQGDVAGLGPKEEVPDFPPPPPFIPLTPSTVFASVPDLLHAFYDQRLQAGISIAEDDAFDQVHSQIGALGQIVVKDPPKERVKKRKEANGDAEAVKKPKKTVPGVGRGNWTRPPKEERDRRAAEKKANLLKQRSSPVADDANGEQEDAEGEDE